MEVTVDELIDLNNRTNEAIDKALKDGIRMERERTLPNNLFEALIKYGNESKTLIDYHKSSGKTDGCNWIQLKPTREGSEGVKYVEISFEENLTEVSTIGIGE